MFSNSPLAFYAVHQQHNAMPTYVLLSTLTPEGRRTVKERPERIKQVSREVEQFGAKVISQYALLGPYDFITVIEAPDNETVGRVSAEMSSRGTVQIASLPAIPVEKFANKLKSAGKKHK